MKVAIIGSGNVGTAVARATKEAGHNVTVAGVSAEQLEEVSEALGVETTVTNMDAVQNADIVVLALPFGVAQDVARDLGDAVADAIVIDVANPTKDDLSGLVTNGTSSAELTQEAAPRARVVKAFNTVLATNQAAPVVDGVQLDGFVAGDDPDAKDSVMKLLEEIGYRPVDVGPLSASRYLEGMGFLNISLNAVNGWSWRSGWKLVGPLS
jgi:predicted dinucleotide-binding enzyme